MDKEREYQIKYLEGNEEGVSACYVLRRKIFVETGMLPDNDPYYESDEHDINSKHFLVSEGEEAVGVGRIIINNPPFKQGVKLREDFKHLYTKDVCEISRIGCLAYLARGILPTLVIAILVTLLRQQKSHFVGVMEPSLSTLLNRLGLSLDKVGPAQDYYGGVRTPYYGYWPKVVHHLAENNPNLYKQLNKELFG